MQELKQQLALTQTLIEQLSMMIISIITPPRITQQTLFDLIAALHPNDPSTLPGSLETHSTPPSRITADHFTVIPTNHRYQSLPKLLGYDKMSTSITQYHLPKNLLWSILTFTFPHSKDLQKVP